MPRKKTALYLDSTSPDFTITDQDGATLTLEDAAKRWKAKRPDDWNIAFGRLAAAEFDLPIVKEFYVGQAATRAEFSERRQPIRRKAKEEAM